jgi:hypothetical protein
MGERLAFLKKKELGLPLWTWAIVAAVVILFLYRRHKASSGGAGATSSTDPNAAGQAGGDIPTSGGASDQSQALAGIANEVALETQLLSNVLDRLQGKKKSKPHKRKHHPKHHRAPHTRKAPVAHHRRNHRKVRPKHRRSSLTRTSLWQRGGFAARAQTFTSSRSMGVSQGGLRKPVLGRLPVNPSEPLAHPRGELHPGTEHLPEVPDRSFTRAPTTVAKRTPLAMEQRTEEVVHRHPAYTKPRKH